MIRTTIKTALASVYGRYEGHVHFAYWFEAEVVYSTAVPGFQETRLSIVTDPQPSRHADWGRSAMNGITHRARGEASTWTAEQVSQVNDEADRLAAKFEARGATGVYTQEGLDWAKQRAEERAKRIRVE